MKSFFDYVREDLGITIPEGNIPGNWFWENDLPMIVQCRCCGMTMASPSAWVDEETYAYCADCADLSKVIKGYTIEETGSLEFISNEYITETND